MNKIIQLGALTAFLSTSLLASAQESLTVIAFGGANGAAIKKHMVNPFAQSRGISVLLDSYSGGIAEMKAQVEAGRIQWDVVSVEALDLERACSETTACYRPVSTARLPLKTLSPAH